MVFICREMHHAYLKILRMTIIKKWGSVCGSLHKSITYKYKMITSEGEGSNEKITKLYIKNLFFSNNNENFLEYKQNFSSNNFREL